MTETVNYAYFIYKTCPVDYDVLEWRNQMKILVSACLLGFPCRYDGKRCPSEAVIRLAERHILIPVCPEQSGGLPTPRIPSEIRGDRVINREGKDVTGAFRTGALIALETAELNEINTAVLKSKSPSCGCGMIYDGSFRGILTEGDGVCASLLKQNGISVYDESQTERLYHAGEK